MAADTVSMSLLVSWRGERPVKATATVRDSATTTVTHWGDQPSRPAAAAT